MINGYSESSYEITLRDINSIDIINIYKITGKDSITYRFSGYDLENSCIFRSLMHCYGFKIIHDDSYNDENWSCYLIVPDDQEAFYYFNLEVLPKLKRFYGTIDRRIKKEELLFDFSSGL